jgi:DNA polymerase
MNAILPRSALLASTTTSTTWWRLSVYIDLETRSTVDLRKVGLYPYARSRETMAILARFRIGDGPQIEWRHGDPLPDEIAALCGDATVRWVAHNAAFERIMWRDCLQRQGWPAPPPLEQWECTMARSRACSLPGGLEDALIATGANVRKDKEGHALMLRMCKPRGFGADGKPYWWDDEDRMQRLADYCGLDVDGTRALDLRLPRMSDRERAIWVATERMNDGGLRFDIPFVHRALEVADKARAILNVRMAQITGRHVPAATNVAALKRWLVDQGLDLTPPPDPFSDPVDEALEEETEPDEDDALPELRRKDVQRLLLDDAVTGSVREALEVRLEAGKTSTKKLNAILLRADEQGCVRGLLAYHGASTGRYSAAGGGVQIQNFPRETEEDWDGARRALDFGVEAVEALYGPTLETLSRMLRGAILPDDGCDLFSVDYSAVELRGVAWLAGQHDLVENLRTGGKIYEQTAAAIYGLPVESIGKDSRERWIGKQVVLGSGYQMGFRKFWLMCLGYGVRIEVELAERAIATYRELNPQIVALWYEANDAMMEAIRNPGRKTYAADGRLVFLLEGMWLRMRIPSGRVLRYARPRIEVDERFGRDGIVYEGVNPKTKRWGTQRTFGGRIVENAVQALCRDLLADAMLRLEERFPGAWRMMTLVHDETVGSAKRGALTVEQARDVICELPAWAAGFPLGAEGWMGARYA